MFGRPVPLHLGEQLAPGTQCTLSHQQRAKGTVIAVDPGEEEGQFDHVTVLWTVEPIEHSFNSGSVSHGLPYDLTGPLPASPLLVNDVSGSYTP
jgi:hypothetical protein